jgi:alkylhydroperoxidase family enzyme
MSHAAVAAKAMGEDASVRAVLADWRTAPVEARLRAALAFLEKLTLAPDEIGPEDVIAARGQGISDAALRQVIYVCFIFSTMDRIADALAFDLPDARTLKRYAWIATIYGYRSLSLPG